MCAASRGAENEVPLQIGEATAVVVGVERFTFTSAWSVGILGGAAALTSSGKC